MKKFLNAVKLSFLFLVIGNPVFSCVKHEVQKPAVPEHPRLLLLKGEEDAIRRTIATDEIWKKLNDFIISESGKIIPRPPVERVLIGRRLLDKSREALRRIFYLSYAYRMTSDSKFLARAEKEMLAVSSFTDWNPSHFLDVAEMTMALSIGYDWLYNSLPEGSRETIRDAIVNKGLKPSLLSQNSGWVKATHNWNQVCNAGMTYGALAVYEDEPGLSAGIIDRAKGSIKLPMEDYNPDGAYPEGYGYWGYGTSFNIMFLAAMEKISGKSEEINPGFLKTASYLENMTGPTGYPFNYSDCGSGGGLNPAMFWFAGRLNDYSVLWSELYHLVNKNPPNDRLLPSIMIWGAGITADKIVPPGKNLWVGQGKNPVALMRSSWTEPNSIYAGLKAGSPSVNHAHMDIGSFIMDANGERWAIDFGSQDYNSLETAGVNLWSMAQNSQRWEVFRYNNFVHNTLTVDNQLQLVKGYSSITAFSDDQDMVNAVTDLTSVYGNSLKKALRGLAIVGNKYVMVRDELETPGKESVVAWNMLTSATVNIIGDNLAELTKNGKKLIMKVISPASIKLRTRSTVPVHAYDAQNPGTIIVGFEASIPANTRAVISVLLMPEGVQEDESKSKLALAAWPVK